MTEIMDRRMPVQRRSATEVGRSIREVFGLDGSAGAVVTAFPAVAPAAPTPALAEVPAPMPEPPRAPASVAGKRRADVSRWRLR